MSEALPTELETPQSNAIAMFCVYFALRAHADEKGFVAVNAETEDEHDRIVADWTNEFMNANAPLDEVQLGFLRYCAEANNLTEAQTNGIMSLAEDGFGIYDIRKLTITAPVVG